MLSPGKQRHGGRHGGTAVPGSELPTSGTSSPSGTRSWPGSCCPRVLPLLWSLFQPWREAMTDGGTPSCGRAGAAVLRLFVATGATVGVLVGGERRDGCWGW